MNASDYKRERDRALARVADLENLLQFTSDTCDISIANTDRERARRIKAEEDLAALRQHTEVQDKAYQAEIAALKCSLTLETDRANFGARPLEIQLEQVKRERKAFQATVQDYQNRLDVEKSIRTANAQYNDRVYRECDELRAREPGMYTITREEYLRTLDRLKGDAPKSAPFVGVILDEASPFKRYHYKTGGLPLFVGDRIRVPVERNFGPPGGRGKISVVDARVVSTLDHYDPSSRTFDLKTVISLHPDSPRQSAQLRLEATIENLNTQLARSNKARDDAWDELDLAQERVELVKKAAAKWYENTRTYPDRFAPNFPNGPGHVRLKWLYDTTQAWD